MAMIDKDTAVEVAARRYRIVKKRWEEYGDYGDFCGAAAFRRVAIELERLPAEEDRPGFRWIPLSEAAPERGRDVLVQMKDGRILTGWVFDEEEMDWFLGTGARYAHNDEIIAWAPLPEPYEEGEA